jgi:acetylglutamate kinase
VTSRGRIVLKLGGELLEREDDLRQISRGIAGLGRRAPLVVVHGGGREIDTALATAGITKTQVDGIRVTDSRTLQVVIAVLAGTINTRLVAAIRRAGARSVGLTGADAGVARVRKATPMTATSGRRIDLGLVGLPVSSGPPQLLVDLLAHGYVPVVACVGGTLNGQLLNVNADTLAAHLASSLGAASLAIAGGTAGVLDAHGTTISQLSSREAARLVRTGAADRGMVAKLEACRAALRRGVGNVVIGDGRTLPLATLAGRIPASAEYTQVVP